MSTIMRFHAGDLQLQLDMQYDGAHFATQLAEAITSGLIERVEVTTRELTDKTVSYEMLGLDGQPVKKRGWFR